MKKLIIALCFIPSIALAAPYAIVSNGTVTNVIEGDGSSKFLSAFPGIVPLTSPGGIGSTYSGGVFSAPTSSAPTQEWISATDFQRRFTQAERIAVRGSTDPAVQDFLDLLSTSPTVNVLDPLTVQGLQYLESKGLIGTGRAAQIGQ